MVKACTASRGKCAAGIGNRKVRIENREHGMTLHLGAMLKAETASRDKFVAFARGHHERLGGGSLVEGLTGVPRS